MPPALLFFLKIALAIWGLWWFHTNFRILCFISLKNATIETLIGIELNLKIALSSMDILRILTLPIHEHKWNIFAFIHVFIHFFNAI